MTLEKVKQIGYGDGADAARESKVSTAPVDGWDGWLINSIGLKKTCELFGESEEENKHGWTEAMKAKLEAYSLGAKEGAAAELVALANEAP